MCLGFYKIMNYNKSNDGSMSEMWAYISSGKFHVISHITLNGTVLLYRSGFDSQSCLFFVKQPANS